MEVLGGMEAVETDEEDRPREEIKILRTSVFMDPFEEAEEEVGIDLNFSWSLIVSRSLLQRKRRRRPQLGKNSPVPVVW